MSTFWFHLKFVSTLPICFWWWVLSHFKQSVPYFLQLNRSKPIWWTNNLLHFPFHSILAHTCTQAFERWYILSFKCRLITCRDAHFSIQCLEHKNFDLMPTYFLLIVLVLPTTMRDQYLLYRNECLLLSFFNPDDFAWTVLLIQYLIVPHNLVQHCNFDVCHFFARAW